MSKSIEFLRRDMCKCGTPFCYTRRPEYKNSPCGCSHCKSCYEPESNYCETCGIRVRFVHIVKCRGQNDMMIRTRKYNYIRKIKGKDEDREAFFDRLAMERKAEKQKR